MINRFALDVIFLYSTVFGTGDKKTAEIKQNIDKLLMTPELAKVREKRAGTDKDGFKIAKIERKHKNH